MRFSYWETMVMNKVLFEVNWFGNLYGTGSILMGLCIGVIFLWGTIVNWKKVKKEEAIKPVEVVSKILLIFAVVTMVIVVVGIFVDYVNIVVSYRNGNCIEVEGVVEDYAISHKQETFILDGVEFSYGKGNLWGYCQHREDGGVIAGNGQHLRIKYIPYKGANVIVYIERTRGENE